MKKVLISLMAIVLLGTGLAVSAETCVQRCSRYDVTNHGGLQCREWTTECH